MSLLFNGDKAIDVVRTALGIGLLDELESGPVSLGELGTRLGVIPMRLYKLLDCLECCGFVRREQAADAVYYPVEGVRQAAVDVLGPDSQERDRDAYPWREIHGKLTEVLTGAVSMPEELFSWPPADDSQVAAFERSMAAGIGPAIEVFRSYAARIWSAAGDRILDVGGGDGTLAANLLRDNAQLTVDVYNLPAVKSLVDETRARTGAGDRLGFVAGDFLAEPLPVGYDVMSFVRVLHDWPPDIANALLAKAYAALGPGGRVMVCEEFRTPERLARQFFWSYFLIGVDSCTSMLREADYYVRVLARLGLRDIEVLDGPFELIVGTKP